MFRHSHYVRAIIIFISDPNSNSQSTRMYKYHHTDEHVSIIMRRHDRDFFGIPSCSRFPDRIMPCGHYNRKYGAALARVRYLHAVRLFQKRIIIYYYYGYAQNNKHNRWYTCFTLSRTRSSPDRSLNTYAIYSSSDTSRVVKFFHLSDKIMEIFFRDSTAL